ncbi:MAG: SIMPL domain-containing protein [Defluviitaleaceae bacterium]|nr:SIMPL domain-containing protein [Defluviitaleaceae bacterium]
MKKLFLAAIFTIALATTAYASISVTGAGTITVEADIAVINLGVRAQNEDVAVALAESAEAIARITDLLAGQGISQVSTSNFNIWESWGMSERGESLTLMEVNNNLTVVLNDLSLINEIIELGVQAGANNIWVSFENSNAEYYRERALELAITNASRRAHVMANALNRQLGDVVTVLDEGMFFAPVSFGMDSRAGAQAATHIAHPGQVQISASVRITFE